MDFADAKAAGLTFATVKNKAGSYVDAVLGLGDGGGRGRHGQART